MRMASGCVSRIAPMTSLQYSVAGAGSTRSPQVPANTSFRRSMAMSQRTPSHWSRIPFSVSIAAARSRAEKAFSCTMSAQAGKYGSRPQASTRSPARTNERGSRARSSSVPATKKSGCSTVHGWSGATWLGTKSRISPIPRSARARRAAARPAGPPRRSSTTYSRTQYGEPTTSSVPRSGRISRNSAMRSGSAMAIAVPAGLRRHTPISQTASTPSSVSRSHAAAGTVASWTGPPVVRPRRSSQGQVSIS